MGRKFSTGGRGAPFGKALAMAVSCARKREGNVSPSFGEGSAPPEGERLRRTGNCPDLSSASLGLELPAAPKKWLGNCTASDAPRREGGREGARTEIGLPLPSPLSPPVPCTIEKEKAHSLLMLAELVPPL